MPDSTQKPLSITDLRDRKAAGEKLSMLTCYDVLIARLLDGAVDALLVGDSVNQVIAGHPTTLNATLDQMIYHGAAVRRGTSHSLVFVDLPFLSYQVSVEEAIRNAGRVLAETNAHGVKLEGGEYMAETVQALTRVGIPVMGHLGLTPQSIHQLGGPKVQGRKREVADRLRSDAKALEQAGANSIVLELVPAALAAELSRSIAIPTIGIGAGPGCDGQVLVLQDMLGLNEGFTPKFLKTYADLAATVRAAARQFSDDVRGGRYPTADHSFD
jgi:3-methyl-2-oxobutanoate hydroxymethyltransferase